MVFYRYAYITIVVALESAALFLPVVSATFSGTGQTSSLFLAALPGALFSIFWKGIRVRDVYILLPVLFITEYVLVFFYSIGTPHRSLLHLAGIIFWEAPDEIGSGIVQSVLIQTGVSLIVAMGLFIKRQNEGYSIRRAGRDEEEQTVLFQMKETLMPEEGLTYFRFKSLFARGQCYVGVKKNKILAALFELRADDILVFYDLLVRPEAENFGGVTLLRHLLATPESGDDTLRGIYFLTTSTPITQLIETLGFREIKDIDEHISVRGKIKTNLERSLPVFEGWKPFGGEYRLFLYTPVLENS